MWWLPYVYIFLLAFCVLQGVIFISKKYRVFVDSSRSRKPQRFHHRPTSRAGGVGVLCGVLCGFWLFGLFSSAQMYFLGACMVIFVSGFLEDMGISLSPKVRLCIQCLGTLLACVMIEHAWLRDLGLGFVFPYVLGVAFSVFAVVGVCNAMNIIDGFNGLSAGVAICVCVSIIIVARQVEAFHIALLAGILLSAVLGFFVLNFPQGKVFLGDGGAYFIGFFLAILLILLTQSPTSVVSPWYGFCVMVYPVWEVLFSILRKKKAKISPMKPDSRHFHMLLFQKLRNNPLTTCCMLCIYVPFIMLATYYYAHTLLLLCFSVIFMCIYSALYYFLARCY